MTEDREQYKSGRENETTLRNEEKMKRESDPWYRGVMTGEYPHKQSEITMGSAS